MSQTGICQNDSLGPDPTFDSSRSVQLPHKVGGGVAAAAAFFLSVQKTQKHSEKRFYRGVIFTQPACLSLLFLSSPRLCFDGIHRVNSSFPVSPWALVRSAPGNLQRLGTPASDPTADPPHTVFI